MKVYNASFLSKIVESFYLEVLLLFRIMRKFGKNLVALTAQQSYARNEDFDYS